MSNIKRFSILFVAVLMVAGMAASAVRPAQAASLLSCHQYHTVQRGEYLVKIARQYDTTWQELAEINQIRSPYRIYSGQQLCVEASGSSTVIPNTGSTTVSKGTIKGAQVYASKVVEDRYATIRGVYLPADTRFEVFFSKPGARAVYYRVGTALSDEDGELKATFDIPKKLVDVSQIYFTLQARYDQYVTNWFHNATLDKDTGGFYDGNASFSIVGVEEDEVVTVKVKDFPAYTDFKAYMTKRGNASFKPVLVKEFYSGKGGTFNVSFLIPEKLWDYPEISLRIVNEDVDLSVSNWFYNGDQGSNYDNGYKGKASFSIIGVEEDEVVTIKVADFPARTDFEAYMTKRGNSNFKPIKVKEFNSGKGGSFKISFLIPDKLEDYPEITLRIVSEDDEIQISNWFYNE
jgi:lipoprotein NlpD